MTDQSGVAPLFEVAISREGTSIRVSLAGELDISTAQSMRNVFVHPEVVGSPVVHVDLTEATFLDSSALGVLVAACTRVRSAGGTFFMTCGYCVRRVIEISGLLEYLEVHS